MLYYNCWESLSPRAWFSDLSLNQSHPEGLLKTLISGSHPQNFPFRWSGVGPGICSSKEFPDADAGGPVTLLRTMAYIS